MKPQLHLAPDPLSVARQFARDLQRWVQATDTFHWALSGGSTPERLFDLLAQHPDMAPDWRRIHLYWGDERCVPPDHTDSNYGMTRDHLLQHIDIPPTQVHRLRGEAPPEREATRYGQLLKSQLPLVEGWPVFDLLMLGLGTDGHTASIFPDQMHLLQANTPCAVARHPESGQLRITLTGGVIQQAEKVAFLITGKRKAAVLEQILQQQEGYERFPASHVKPVDELHYYLDQAASGNQLT